MATRLQATIMAQNSRMLDKSSLPVMTAPTSRTDRMLLALLQGAAQLA